MKNFVARKKNIKEKLVLNKIKRNSVRLMLKEVCNFHIYIKAFWIFSTPNPIILFI